MTRLVYERDGAAIYRQSFATIRAEADLAAVPATCWNRRGAHDPCLRHDRPRWPSWRRRPVSSPRRVPRCDAGAPIFCDSMMVANGVTRARLPAGNDVRCTLQEPGVPAEAAAAGTRARPPPSTAGSRT